MIHDTSKENKRKRKINEIEKSIIGELNIAKCFNPGMNCLYRI